LVFPFMEGFGFAAASLRGAAGELVSDVRVSFL